MSADREIDQICPHTVVEEALFVSSDRFTVRPLRPIASVASVAVMLNHILEIPSMGVASPAQSMGTREGPFVITSGTNDTLSLKIDQGSVQTITLDPTNHLATDRLASILNTSFQGVQFSSVDNKLAFRSLNQGISASIFMLPTTLSSTTLGIASNREYRGQQVVPGWTLVADPNTLPDRPTRLIVFDNPLRGSSDFVEINYNTVRQECRRCGGTGVENDWRYGSDGEIVLTRDENLLIQELQKDFYTLLGSNPFHTWYGASLLDTIGKKLTAGGFVQNLIVSDIYQAFSRWQGIKSQQEQTIGQFVSDKEYPFRLLSVDLQQSTDDPTVIFVSVTIMNRSSDPIQLTRGLKLPQPTDLLGSTTAQGLIRQSISKTVLSG